MKKIFLNIINLNDIKLFKLYKTFEWVKKSIFTRFAGKSGRGNRINTFRQFVKDYARSF